MCVCVVCVVLCCVVQIDAPKDPYPLKARKDGCLDNDMCTVRCFVAQWIVSYFSFLESSNKDMSEEQMEEETKILEVVDPSKQVGVI